MDQKSVQNLLNGNFTFGSDVSVAAGPTGAQADINAAPASVITYQMGQEGAYLGANLQGAVLSIDQDASQRVYGHRIAPNQMLATAQQVPQSVAVFDKALSQFAPADRYDASAVAVTDTR